MGRALYFYDKEGNPIAAESVVDLTGDLEITEDVQTEMAPLGELTISTHGQGEVVSGSVTGECGDHAYLRPAPLDAGDQ